MDTKQKILEILNCTDVKNSNANVDEYSFGGRKFEAAGLMLKEIAMEQFIKPEVAQAFKENRIYIHDMDNYATGMHNCLFVDFKKLFTDGFTTRNGDVRPPKSISTAMQQVAVIFQCQSQVQFGGVASAHIDFDLAPFVGMSFVKHFKDGLKFLNKMSDEEIEKVMSKYAVKMSDNNLANHFTEAYDYAYELTERECLQAAQGLYHNLNTLESRAGSQLPFTSINFGRDTSPEGRMVSKSLLLASLDGIGKFHKTSIFPIAIFQHKKGINANPGDPNYDLKQLAIKSLCKRIYPNFVNCDFSGNIEDITDPDTYMATMGCRTMLGYDRHGFGYSKVGRGNITPMTLNLPKLGIKYGICLGEREEADISGFYNELDELLDLVETGLVDRYKFICSQNPKSGPFMYHNHTIRGFDGENIESAMKHGTNAIGVLGIAETCQALFGKNHTDKEVHAFAMDLIKYIYNFTKEAGDRNDMNFSCYFTPAESCCHTMCRKTREEFGSIPCVTDKEFFTNSIHVPVWEEVGIFEKIDIEAPFCEFGTAGCITYTEFESKIMNNPEAVESIINYAMKNNVPYLAINFPIDTCLDCGFSGDIAEVCPKCNGGTIEHLARVTGYLTTDVSHFNKGKKDEVQYRYKHSQKTFGDHDE